MVISVLSIYMTLLRNNISKLVQLKHYSNYYNVVGNVLGNDGLRKEYEASKPNYSLPVTPFLSLVFLTSATSPMFEHSAQRRPRITLPWIMT